MISSDGFGGGAAGARPRVQVRPTTGTESGTIVPAQQELTRYRERKLFPNDRSDIDAGRSRRQWIEVGVVRGIGVIGKYGRADVEVDLLQHLGETPTTLTPYHSVEGPLPEILAFARGLEMTVNQDTPDQIEIESLERWIIRAERPFGTCGTPLQVPDIHSQHSLLR